MNEGLGREKSGPILSEDVELIRKAITAVHALPASLPDEEGVIRIIRIRKALDRDLRDRIDPRVIGARIVRRSLLISISAATVVSAAGIWRVLDRFTTSLGVLDSPVPFLFLFSFLFFLSWVPVIVGILRRRKMIQRGPKRSAIDTTLELRAFDLGVVRGLLKG